MLHVAFSSPRNTGHYSINMNRYSTSYPVTFFVLFLFVSHLLTFDGPQRARFYQSHLLQRCHPACGHYHQGSSTSPRFSPTIFYRDASSALLHLVNRWYTTVHYSTLQYTTVHYSTLHYTTLHYSTLHYSTLHYTTLHYTTVHYTTLHYTTVMVQFYLHTHVLALYATEARTKELILSRIEPLISRLRTNNSLTAIKGV